MNKTDKDKINSILKRNEIDRDAIFFVYSKLLSMSCVITSSYLNTNPKYISDIINLKKIVNADLKSECLNYLKQVKKNKFKY